MVEDKRDDPVRGTGKGVCEQFYRSWSARAGWADGDRIIFVKTHDEPKRRGSGVGIAGECVLAGILRDGTI